LASTVLVYGDSNSYGTKPMPTLLEKERFGPDVRWPCVMAAELGRRWRLVEEGLPGRTTVHPDPIEGVHKNGLAVLPAVLESHSPIDLVILMLGTNDLKARFQVPPVEIAAGVEQLVRLIRQNIVGPQKAAPSLLLVSPPNVIEAGCLAEIFAGAEPKSRRLAGFYAEVARRWGAAFLDAGEVIGPSPVDGVHFEAGDHVRLGRRVAEAVKATFEEEVGSERGSTTG
jgi:lysophospholipase L1-like esterase